LDITNCSSEIYIDIGMENRKNTNFNDDNCLPSSLFFILLLKIEKNNVYIYRREWWVFRQDLLPLFSVGYLVDIDTSDR